MRSTVTITLRTSNKGYTATFPGENGKLTLGNGKSPEEAFLVLAKGLSSAPVRQLSLKHARDNLPWDELPNRWVLFLDLLGFSTLQKLLVTGEPDVRETARRQLEALRPILAMDLEHAFWSNLVGIHQPWPDLRIASFSDSIVVTTADMCSGACAIFSFMESFLERSLVDAGFLVRGGLAYGPAIHGDNVVVGPAIVDAVHAEKCAKMPRINIHETAEGMLKNEPDPRPLNRNDQAQTSYDLISSIEFCHTHWANPATDDPEGTKRESTAKILQRVRTALNEVWNGRPRGSSEDDQKITQKIAWLIDRYNQSVSKGLMQGFCERLETGIKGDR